MNNFEKLAPFIREFIYRNGWDSLRDIQNQAIEAVLETNDNILICSGTASGKTEAVFFPVFSQIYNKKINGVSVLYIGPLKALINDQFKRINDIIASELPDIPVCHWHGDAPVSQKKKLLKNPRGILQITPESLESLFINHMTDICALFANLKFIIIDEVHAFMGSDRGSQLICLLHRIGQMTGRLPRRIGLSATLGDYEGAAKWLSMGLKAPVQIIRSNSAQRIRLSVEHFNASDEEKGRITQYLYEKTVLKKSIIFTNKRSDAEQVVAALKENARKKNLRDYYFVHHGSLSAMLRHDAEQALKNELDEVTVAATVTLELGIDIGDLDRTLQIGAPFSCSSFVQRMGRSGRRSGVAEMLFISSEDAKNKNQEDADNTPLPDMFCYDLLAIIAIVELYRNEKWIEPINSSHLPYSLLYQQTMSMLASLGEMTPSELAKRILTMPPFENITQDDYRELLNHLIKNKHIEKVDEGGLIIGLSGERIVNSFRFYSVFPEESEFKVFYESKEIGQVNKLPPINVYFALAGCVWKVIDIDADKKAIFVNPVKGRRSGLWSGSNPDIHSFIINKMREVLTDTEEGCFDADKIRQKYPYLSESSVKRLIEMRKLSEMSGIGHSKVIEAGENAVYLMPWIGDTHMRTLERALSISEIKAALGIYKISMLNPYCLLVHTRIDTCEFEKKLMSCISCISDNMQLLRPDEEISTFDKYDDFLPEKLLKKGFAYNRLDLEGLKLMLI